jgi:ferredoxin
MTTAADTRPLRHWLHGTDAPHLVICCAEHPDPGAWSHAKVGSAGSSSQLAVVQLSTCIAQVNPAVLLELVAGGASVLTVALDGCANPSDAQVVVARAATFLSALGRHEAIAGALALPRHQKHGVGWPILGEGDIPVSRRALLGRTDGLELSEPNEHPGKRLVGVLGELAQGNGLGTQLDAIPTGIPMLTASGCAGSGVCARTCPVDALTLTRTVLAEANTERDAIAQFQLAFDPVKCTGCGQCLQVCPESALQQSGLQVWSSLLSEEPVTLRAGLIRRCGRCGVGHGQTGELCDVCAYRAENPFGSTMPPRRSNGADPKRLAQPPSE